MVFEQRTAIVVMLNNISEGDTVLNYVIIYQLCYTYKQCYHTANPNPFLNCICMHVIISKLIHFLRFGLKVNKHIEQRLGSDQANHFKQIEL